MPQPWLGTFVVSVGDQAREAHSLGEPSATLPVDVRQHEAVGALHDGLSEGTSAKDGRSNAAQNYVSMKKPLFRAAFS